MTSSPRRDADAICLAHQLYCQLTGQTLRLAFDRQRMWFELLRAGYTLHDVRSVVLYLQREIRAQRRNVGALKLQSPPNRPFRRGSPNQPRALAPAVLLRQVCVTAFRPPR